MTSISAPTLDLDDLSRRFGHRLRLFIGKRVSNSAEVEDLVQTTYVEALRSQKQFRGAALPQTWLFGIALNLVRHHRLRSPRRHSVMVDIDDCPDLAAADPHPPDLHALREASRHVLDALGELPESTRDLIELICIDGLTYEAAADRLGIPVGTVRSRLSRARSRIRDRLAHVPDVMELP